MSDIVIHARDLTKVYRLYTSPRHRFLDMFGLLQNTAGAYAEHAALAGVSLDIRRGEKVAFIGRNGAGKSTLLKLLTKVIEPTSGTLEVKGKAHALLQIGSGFHPDFTGRENVYAYLAQLGVTGAEADRRYAEIVEFAELEEYIGQPVKTYSSGMAVRLMFSTSTAITPDLLVLDEVLGVGDAYFAHKSYERIRLMCEGEGTTLLLVTHDIYSAAKLCNRLVWIDAGRVMVDGPTENVIKAYEDSVRAQEEKRLRLRVQTHLAAAAAIEADHARVIVEIHARGNRPQPSAVYFARIAVSVPASTPIEVPLGDRAFDTSLPAHLIKDAGRWGDVERRGDRVSRAMLNFGGPFHKVAAAVALPSSWLQPESGLSFEFDHWSAAAAELEVVAYVNGVARRLGPLTAGTGNWQQKTLAWESPIAEAVPELRIHPSGDQGAGDIVITKVDIVDDAGDSVLTVKHGQAVSFRLEFEIARRSLLEKAQVFLVISKDNTLRVCKFMTSELQFDGRHPRGVVTMRWPKVMLAAGRYSLAAEVAAEGYAEKGMVQFFSVDPEVYHCLTHALKFVVTDSGWMGDYTIFEGYGDWSLTEVGSDA